MRGVDDVRLDASGLEDVGEPYARPFRAAHGAVGPRVSLRGRVEERAAVAAALQNEGSADYLEPVTEVVDVQRYRPIDEAVDGQLPSGRIRVLRRNSVVPDKMTFRRRDGVIQQVGRRFRV